jgi:hypothetical protein
MTGNDLSVNKPQSVPVTFEPPCITRDQLYTLTVPLLYSMHWLLHVSAVAGYNQGAYKILPSYLKYKFDRWYII